jgi:pyridoxine 5-phosphate synthase
MAKLGVNIDHVATIREARRTYEPSPVAAAAECIAAGADSIVCHLREDRRHIKDEDVTALRRKVRRLNLEMSVEKDIVDIACRVRPDQATLVPERRMEVTTEGGLDVRANAARIKRVVSRLHAAGIDVSLFVDPSADQIEASADTGARIIELHTGRYAAARSAPAMRRQLDILIRSAAAARSCGLEVNAGHGLNYENARAVANIKGMHELNIGHSIISRAVFVGLKDAVKDMVRLVR